MFQNSSNVRLFNPAYFSSATGNSARFKRTILELDNDLLKHLFNNYAQLEMQTIILFQPESSIKDWLKPHKSIA